MSETPQSPSPEKPHLGVSSQQWDQVYTSLKELAYYRLRQAPPSSTFSTTMLVHEAYLKLAANPDLKINDQNHLLALSARAMRFIIVEYLRRKSALKRADGELFTLNEEAVGKGREPLDVLMLDQALRRLEDVSPRMVQVVECRFFSGMTNDEIASALNVTTRTIERDWQKAKLLVYSFIQDQNA